jgi:excisionase family DNA binding protein
MIDDELLSPRKVAALFGVDARTVSRWARDGKMPSLLTPGGHRRFRRSDVDKALGNCPGVSPSGQRCRLRDRRPEHYAGHESDPKRGTKVVWSTTLHDQARWGQ